MRYNREQIYKYLAGMKTRTFVMGILNVTPDSFSDGGRYPHIEDAVNRAVEMVKQGVDIIDIGGESTTPGHITITDEEEIARVVPVISRLVEMVEVPICV